MEGWPCCARNADKIEIFPLEHMLKKIVHHPFFRNSAVMFAGTMLTNVLAYIYHLVVGRTLGPAGYGELAALLSIFYILNSPSVIAQNILVKFFSQLRAKEDHGQGRRLFVRISRLLLFAEGIALVLLLPFVGALASFLNIEAKMNLILLYLMFGAFLFTIVNISVLQAYQQFVAISVVNALGGVLRLVFGAVAAVFGVGWTLGANVIASLVGYVSSFVPLRPFLAHKEQVISLSPAHALYYSIPTFVAVFSVNALYSLDVVLVKHFFNPVDAGVYSSLSVLGKIIFFASYSIGQVAFPMLAERKELGKSYGKIIFAALGIVAAISFGLTAVYSLFPEMVVNLLFGPAFASASGYLGIFGLFISLYTLVNLFTTMYIALGRTQIWVFSAGAAILQAVIISLAHENLTTVIVNNTILVGGLFIILLLFYPYAERKK